MLYTLDMSLGLPTPTCALATLWPQAPSGMAVSKDGRSAECVAPARGVATHSDPKVQYPATRGPSRSRLGLAHHSPHDCRLGVLLHHHRRLLVAVHAAAADTTQDARDEEDDDGHDEDA